MNSKVVRNSQRGGYDYTSNGQSRCWAVNKRELKKAMQNMPVVLIYPDGVKKSITVDIAHKLKGN